MLLNFWLYAIFPRFIAHLQQFNCGCLNIIRKIVCVISSVEQMYFKVSWNYKVRMFSNTRSLSLNLDVVFECKTFYCLYKPNSIPINMGNAFHLMVFITSQVFFSPICEWREKWRMCRWAHTHTCCCTCQLGIINEKTRECASTKSIQIFNNNENEVDCILVQIIIIIICTATIKVYILYIRSLGTNFNNCSTTERTNQYDQSLSRQPTNECVDASNFVWANIDAAGPRCNFSLKSICTQFICNSLHSQLEYFECRQCWLGIHDATCIISVSRWLQTLVVAAKWKYSTNINW